MTRPQRKRRARPEVPAARFFEFMRLPVNSRTTVRIFAPPWREPADFFEQVYVHRNLGRRQDQTLECLGANCPVCMWVRSQLHEVSSERFGRAVAPLWRVPRYFFNAVRISKRGPVRTVPAEHAGEPATECEVLCHGDVRLYPFKFMAPGMASDRLAGRAGHHDFVVTFLESSAKVTPTRAFAHVHTRGFEQTAIDLALLHERVQPSQLEAALDGAKAQLLDDYDGCDAMCGARDGLMECPECEGSGTTTSGEPDPETPDGRCHECGGSGDVQCDRGASMGLGVEWCPDCGGASTFVDADGYPVCLDCP